MSASRIFAVSTSVFVLACSGGEGPTGASGSMGTGGAVIPPASGAGAGGGSAGASTTPVPGGGGAVSAGGAITGSSGGATTPPNTGGAPVIGTGGATGAAAAPSGGGTTSAGGAAGAGGAAVVDPPGTMTIQTGDFQIDPGGEVFKCQNFDNPFGKDTAVSRIVSDMSPGSHHLHLYNLTEGTSRTIEDCSPTDFHALVHAAGRPHSETAYPAGMATKLKGTNGLRIQLHYLNTATEQKTASASLKLSPVESSTVSKWVASLYFNRVKLSVPPGTGQTVTTTCSIPSAYGQIGLVGAGSHMHQRGVHFVAKTNTGTMLIEDTTWDEPAPHAYDPPVMLNPGDSITWTCTYNNDTGMTLTFGDSAVKNEMCIVVGRYYSSNQNDAQIACQSQQDDGGTAFLQPN
jgi:hypothetical protein